MKIVVTILQCRRVVLPHLFVKHALPRMQQLVDGDVETVIVQHRADASDGPTKLESTRDADNSKLEVVRQWTEEGRYDGAEIIEHRIVHPSYPSIPGLHLGVKAALERNADFHLWLEDDAFVMDPSCGFWESLLGKSEVGVYRRFHNLNTAYLVTRPSFDERIINGLADYRGWTWRRRIEPWLRRRLKTSRAFLSMSHAVRYHHQSYPYTGIRYVADKIRELSPEDLYLLDVDFGHGCRTLRPITEADLEEDRARDGAHPLARLGRLTHGMVQRYRVFRESAS